MGKGRERGTLLLAFPVGLLHSALDAERFRWHVMPALRTTRVFGCMYRGSQYSSIVAHKQCQIHAYRSAGIACCAPRTAYRVRVDVLLDLCRKAGLDTV